MASLSAQQRRQIEALKDRFVKHCTAGPAKSAKSERVKLKIKKTEEDSHGIEHFVENQVNYVRQPVNEEEDSSTCPSPQSLPGAGRRKLQQTLMEKIRAKKLKDHEERVKSFRIDNEEDVDDKEEEIIEDEDDISENDQDSDEPGDDEEVEEEESPEDILDGQREQKKAKTKKSAFVDDEAEDEDDDASTSEEENDEYAFTDEDDEPISKDGTDSSKHSEEKNADTTDSPERKEKDAASIDVEEDEDASNETDEPFISTGADYTPKVTSAVLNQRTPSDFWLPAGSYRQADELSPLIPRINKVRHKDCQVDSSKNTSPTTVPETLAGLISESKAGFDELVNLCSGRFASQVVESEEEEEFGCFDFGDNDEFLFAVEKEKENLSTPKADTSRAAIDGITPKLCNDDQEIIGARIKGRKLRRLQFSDDEDEDDPDEEDKENFVEMPEDEEFDNKEIPGKIGNPFFNKFGRLKKKFVEDEAELSGSDEDSADEDEAGLNHYEEEEGDDEELDEDSVKNQVERAHLKQMLDDDDREIRLLQDKYLENGDLTDKQRERKFTWNLNMNDLNDDANFVDSDDEVDENAEDASLKQAWIDKRKWMSENSHLLEVEEDESQSLLSNSRFLKVSKSTIKKLEACVNTTTSDSSSFIIQETSSHQRRSIYDEVISSKGAAKTQISSINAGKDQSNKSNSESLIRNMPWTNGTTAFKKGSFLSRGNMLLTKLTDTKKTGDAVSNVKSNYRNFVFQHITPPNEKKTDGSSSRIKRGATKLCNQVAAKKPKVDRSFSSLDDASKGASIFKWL